MNKYIIKINDQLAVKKVKLILEENRCFDKTLKILKDPTGSFNIPVMVPKLQQSQDFEKIQNFFKSILPADVDFSVKEVTAGAETDGNENNTITGTTNTLSGKLEILFTSLNIDSNLQKKIMSQFPKRHSIYPPLLLLPPNSLDSAEWSDLLLSLSERNKNELFHTILEFFSTPTNKLTHLAINKPIPESDNEIRSPTQLTTLYGNFENFWCHTIQNGIYQTWMPVHTMFSRGNIKEKARILNEYRDINSSLDVVDMYAGIGYFTLSYLKRGARRVFCWEINPYSVEGLAKNVEKNKFGKPYIIKRDEPVSLERVLASRCIIFLESNEYCLDRFQELMNQGFKDLSISHVNLGLLPTSKFSWPYTSKIIDTYGSDVSWVHVHENIGVKELEDFMIVCNNELQQLSQTAKVEPVWLEKVKTFAPDVYHIVGDFKFTKTSS